MKFITYLLLSCFFFSNAGYAAQNNVKTKTKAKQTGSISGQVFVVTKGGESVKLALVGVSAIPEKQIIEYLSTSQNLRRESFNKYISIRKEAEDALLESGRAMTRVQELYFNDKTPEGKKAFADYARWANLSELKSAQNLEASAMWNTFANGGYYFSQLPLAVSASKTDVDGKFKLDLPAGRYALAAKSSRKIYGETEEYYWLVWVNVTSNQFVMLSNDNLFETSCKDCVQPDNVLPEVKPVAFLSR
ncbi:MAG: hypothetical protein WC710_09320 [Gallionella sp.]|jgi:hypothetical protein